MLYQSSDNSKTDSDESLISFGNIKQNRLLPSITKASTYSCFICLSEVSTNYHAMLPCRHASICKECFEVCKRHPSSPICGSKFVCPLCRSPVNSVILLPSI